MEERDGLAEDTASRVNSISKKTIFIAAVVLLAFIMARLSFSLGRSLFYVAPAEEAPGTDIEINIAENDTLDSIAKSLYDSGAITNVRSFMVQAKLYKTDFYQGSYVVNSSMTVKEMLETIDKRAEELSESAEALENGADTDDVNVGYEGDAVDGAAAEGVDIAIEESTADGNTAAQAANP